MGAKRRIGSRQLWTVAAWLVIAALAVTGVVLEDVSIAIAAGVAAGWALCFGFFPAPTADRG
jgi:hypothetical protein